jgi:uncharacterized protein with gpF-like domain
MVTTTKTKKTPPANIDIWLRGVFTPYVKRFFPEPPADTPGPEYARYVRQVLEWKSYDDDRRNFEKKWFQLFDQAFREWSKELASSYSTLPVLDATVSSAVLIAETRMKRMIELLRQDVETFFLRRQATQQKAAKKPAGASNPPRPTPKPRKPKPSDELLDIDQLPELVSWNTRTMASKITQISKVTAEKIRKLIASEIEKGTSVTDIAIKLEKFGFPSSRALAISRTEVLSASNAATFYGTGAALGTAKLRKDWLATQDKRTRQTHSTAGRTQKNVDYDKPFNVGGARLLFPGDSSLGAPPKEIVRCRCTTTFQLGR